MDPDIRFRTRFLSFWCVLSGIRGTQFQRRATKLQRTTAFVGTILSLLTFMTLTVIVTILSG